MRLPLSILIVMAAAIAVVFAVPNREAVTLRFWPFDVEVAVALYLAIFAAAFAGFLAGWTGAWLSQRKWRKRARERARRIEHLESEVMTLTDAAAKPTEAQKSPAVPLERWTLPGA